MHALVVVALNNTRGVAGRAAPLGVDIVNIIDLRHRRELAELVAHRITEGAAVAIARAEMTSLVEYPAGRPAWPSASPYSVGTP